MKNRIAGGLITFALGLLIAAGPQFLFKVCGTMGGGVPRCHWSAQAEIAIGALIAALGLAYLVFSESNVRLGLTVGVLFSGIVALCIPHVLIGGCDGMTMACRKTAFPALTLIGIIVVAASAANAAYLAGKQHAPPVTVPD
jgi:hypothetical protein